MGVKIPSKTGGSRHRIEAETGNDAIRKDKDSFRIVFPEGRGWCTSPDGRRGDLTISFDNPRASTSLFSKERGIARKQCALVRDGTTPFDSIHLPFIFAHFKKLGRLTVEDFHSWYWKLAAPKQDCLAHQVRTESLEHQNTTIAIIGPPHAAHLSVCG